MGNQKNSTDKTSWSIKEIRELFKGEFVYIAEKFNITLMSLNALTQSKAPGVYVFWKHNSVIKVGRSLTNAMARALQHIGPDDTGNKADQKEKDWRRVLPRDQGMKVLKNDELCHLLLFTIKERDDRHWIAALELFLEDHLEPEIRSKRH